MKARFFLLFVTIFTVSPFAKAEWSDRAYSDRRLLEEIEPIKEGTCINTTAIKALNEGIQKIESDVSRLQKKVEALNERIQKLESDVNGLKKLDNKVKGTDRNANIALWISLSIVLSVCGILCLVFWPRKSRAATLSPTLSDKHKCPRCGWEHDPGDTVCRNPNCRTQF